MHDYSVYEYLFTFIEMTPAPSHSHTLSRKERDHQLRCKDFLKAAEQLFSIKGFYQTTMEDIAREAGYGTGTIYLYFKKKGDLYDKLLEQKISEYVTFMEEHLKSTPTHTGKIRALVFGKLEYFERHKEFFRIYLAEQTTVDTTLHRMTNRRRETMYNKYREYVTTVLADAMKAGAIRETDPARLATAMTGIVNPLLSEWIKERSNEPIEDIGHFVINLLMKGLEMSNE